MDLLGILALEPRDPVPFSLCLHPLSPQPLGLVEGQGEEEEDGCVLLYGHRNHRRIRDGSPERPPRLSHSSGTLRRSSFFDS